MELVWEVDQGQAVVCGIKEGVRATRVFRCPDSKQAEKQWMALRGAPFPRIPFLLACDRKIEVRERMVTLRVLYRAKDEQ